ncbi:hypothetical protein NC797_06660 [Aquibacillus sp. 3ASR75-11]|uniref:Lipoprotein n=1 Tax=Terrihalobacillus insolitus TaxID=2950438 RepID=A0A9X3WT63_9BACI|nr:hypothetical protein [Terrihalobacillus insolitus]MDC3414699.1 hypothetical protein [Terrihalobacillus insolitus]MDC3424188.1 hypothetical protein [Terrihalobacillus insolitus]
MRKFVMVITSLLILSTVTSCVQSSEETNETDISYKNYFNGFLVYQKNQEVPTNLLIFTNKEDWQYFSEKYVAEGERVASMDDNINWDKEDLIYYATTGSKPGYVSVNNFKGYQIKNNSVLPIFAEDSKQNTLLAVNNLGQTSSIDISYNVWTIVKKKDVPKGVKNFYNRS